MPALLPFRCGQKSAWQTFASAARYTCHRACPGPQPWQQAAAPAGAASASTLHARPPPPTPVRLKLPSSTLLSMCVSEIRFDLDTSLTKPIKDKHGFSGAHHHSPTLATRQWASHTCHTAAGIQNEPDGDGRWPAAQDSATGPCLPELLSGKRKSWQSGATDPRKPHRMKSL